MGSGTILREVLAGARAAARRLRRRRRRLERPELHRAAARGHGGRALEHAAPGRGAATHVGRAVARRAATGPVIAATDYMRSFADQIRPWVERALPRARHRRLRPQRLPQDAALVLRGRPPPRRAGGADRAGEDGRGRRDGARARRSSPTASTPSGPRRGGSEGGGGGWHRAGPRPGHRGLRRRTRDRGAGLGGRHRRRRGPAGRRWSPTRRRWRSRRRAAGKVAAIEVARRRQGQGGLAAPHARGRAAATAPSRAPAGAVAEAGAAAVQGRRGRDPGGGRRPPPRRPPPPHVPASPQAGDGRGARLRVARRAPAGARARRRPLDASAGPAARAGSPRRTSRSRAKDAPAPRRAPRRAGAAVAGPGPRPVAEGQLRDASARSSASR